MAYYVQVHTHATNASHQSDARTGHEATIIEAIFEHLTKATFVRAVLPTLRAASGFATVRRRRGYVHTASFCNLGVWVFGCDRMCLRRPHEAVVTCPFRSRSGVCPLLLTGSQGLYGVRSKTKSNKSAVTVTVRVRVCSKVTVMGGSV
jgi:hypothetical protein